MAEMFDIVDAHIHLFRDTPEEARRFPHAGWPASWYSGSEATVERFMDFHNIMAMWCMHVIPERWIDADLERDGTNRTAKDLTAEERRSLIVEENRWAVSVGQRHPRLPQFIMADPVAFGSALVHEVEECLSLGARGVKVHPHHCGHLPDYPDMYPTYDLCQARGIPMTTCSGARSNTDPHLWEPVLRQFPRLRLIMAHLPGELWDERVELAAQFPDLMFDTAGGLVDRLHPPYVHREMPAEHAVRVFRKIGIGRILFGSDGFFGDPIDQARQIVALDLTDDEKEQILSKNAAALIPVSSHAGIGDGSERRAPAVL